MLEYSTIISYLVSLPAADSLYKDPVFSLGLLKLFNDDVRRLVFTLLTSSVHISRLKSISNIKESLGTIVQIKLASKVDDKIVLCEQFRTALLQGFCLASTDLFIVQQRGLKALDAARAHGSCQNAARLAGRSPAADTEPGKGCGPHGSPSLAPGAPRRADVDGLVALAERLSAIKFQGLLQAIVSSDPKLMFGVKDILVFCSLTDPLNQITSKGFEFLLKNRVDQHWFIILSSIKYFAHGLDEERVILGHLMELCVKDGPGLFGVRNWTNWHAFLNSIGVLHVLRCPSGFNGRSLPTLRQSVEDLPVDPVLVEAVDGLEAEVGHLETALSYFYLNSGCLFDTVKPVELNSHKYIILETNFKIYAYTDKEYEKSILGLFSRTVYTLPNLIKAQLDEESVTSAYAKGITAVQLLKYLGEFAESVPPSIANQIIIWENKQHRIVEDRAVMYSDFLHLSDYLEVLRFLEHENAVLLKDEAKRIIVGTESTHARVRDLLKEL